MSKLSRMMLGCLTTLTLAGTASAKPHMADAARKALLSGDRVEAQRVLEGAWLEIQSEPETLKLLGDLRFHHGETAQAVNAWAQALELEPHSFVYAERVMKGAGHLGDYARASKAAGTLVRLAKAHWAESIELAPGKAQLARERWLNALLTHAELACLAGDYTTAEASARAHIEAAPGALEGMLSLAYVHLSGDEFDEAEALYLQILERSPKLADVHNNLGMIHYLRGDLESAEAAYARGLEYTTQEDGLESLLVSNLGELAMLRGAYVDARRLYEDAIEVAPESPWGYMGLATVFELNDEPDAALDAMIDGWSRDPSRLSRLNTRFQKDEWYWHRDALIAELEGETDLAVALWSKIAAGTVEALLEPAKHHLQALRED